MLSDHYLKDRCLADGIVFGFSLAIVICTILISFWTGEIREENKLSCKEPKSLGDRTIMSLVNKDNALIMKCEYHSVR